MKYKVICQNCKKEYYTTVKTKKEQQICRDCYQIIYSNTDIKRQQANKMLIKNLKHLHWYINDNHIPFNNEAENNFALILEYLNNEYTYQDNYKYIDNNQFIYQYHFFRLKNNTIYILEFCLTYTIRLRIKSFLNEYNEKVHIITHKKYERILKYFNTKINFTYNQYPLQYYVLHICPICNNNFYANIQQIYCSNQCKHKSMNKQYKKIRTNLYQYKLTNEQLNNLQCANLQATNKKLLKQMHNLNSNNININNINLQNEEINFIKILQYLKLEFYYETEYKQLSTGKILIMKFYLPIDNHYYFLTFIYTHNYINKIKQYINENKNNNCIIINKYIYEQLIILYQSKINFLKTDICIINTDINDTNNDIKKCKYCGKKLYKVKKTRQYCSRKCYELAKRKYIEKTCINCNKQFLILNDDINNQYFCSQQCGKEYKNKIINNNKLLTITENNIIKKFYNTECEYCHKQHYYFGTRKHKYCSILCKRKIKSNTEIQYKCICKECNKEFINIKKDKQFCSVNCASKYHAREQGFGSKVRPSIVWNKGLTTKTDKRMKNMIEKRTKTIQQNIENGKSNIHGYYSGYYEDIHHYVRSGWEHNIARILQYNKLNYDYEPQIFTLSTGQLYMPDFYVYADNTYYEIKGEWKNNALEKLQLFKQEYPNINIIIIEKDTYKWLLQQYKNVINVDNHTPIEINDISLNQPKYRYKSGNEFINIISNQLIDINNYNPDDFYTGEEVCKILNISWASLVHYRNKGKIQYLHISERKNLYLKSSIQNILYNKKNIISINYKKICKQCHKSFFAKYKQACYCSHECRILHEKLRNKKDNKKR